MRQVHVMFQSKGGVGKSYIASLICQRYERAGLKDKVLVLDLDPDSKTLSGHYNVGARFVSVTKADKVNIDGPAFDRLFGEIMNETRDIIIDTGSRSATNVLQYLIAMGASDLLASKGAKLIAHTVLNAGSRRETLLNLQEVVKTLPESAEIYTWVNEYGDAKMVPGGTFEGSNGYKVFQNRIAKLCQIPQPTGFGEKDAAYVIEERLTYPEALVHPDIEFAVKHRLERWLPSLNAEVDRMITVG